MLGGPSTYGGVIVEKSYIGDGKTEDYLSTSKKAIGITKTSSLFGTGIAAVILYMRNLA
jgi:cobalamin biosynthesis protein CobD/CbiB